MPGPPVRLLVVSGSLAGGGAERVASTLLAHLDRAQVEPRLCLLRGPVEYPLPADVPVTVLHKDRPWHLPRTVLRLRRVLAEVRPDAVMSMIAFVNLVTGAALWGQPSPVHWIARVGAPVHTDRPLRGLLHRLYRRAGTIAANSESLAGSIGATFADLRDRVVVLPNPTDFEAIERAAGRPRPAEPPVIVAVGRLTLEKRPDLLIEAFARVHRTRACRLCLVGDGPLRGRTEQAARAAGVAGAVDFLGQVDNPYLPMRAAALFALSSDTEGLPNALIEAQGLGLPAVATRCGGAEEIVADGETGLLVPCGDAAALAAGIDRLLGDADLRARMGAAAARRARERYAAAAVVRRFEALLAERVTGTRRTSSPGTAATR